MFLASLCLFTLGVINSVAQTAVAALHHNGNVTLYSGGQLQKALDAAESGDTIYLSEGTFTGNVTIYVDTYLIGAGENTIITGDLDIGKSTNILNYGLESLCVLNRVRVEHGERGFISQCKLNSFYANSITDYKKEVVISRCYINEIGLGYFDSISVYNSKLGRADGGGDNCTVKNCNIGYTYSGGVYINSMLQDLSNNLGANCYNCLFSGAANNMSNCYEISNSFLDDNLDCTLTDLSNYLGNDGTVVGITGGDNPYNLTPSAPHVASHKIEVDKANQKLNVTLTIEN